MITSTWQPLAIGDGNYDTMHTWAGNGNAARVFELNFTGGYISQADVKAFMLKRGTSEQVDLTVQFVNTNSVKLNQAVPEGWDVTIYRDTPKDKPSASFIDGALITAANLDRNTRQAIYGVAELADRMTISQNTSNQALDTAKAAVAGVVATQATADRAVVIANDATTTAKGAMTKSNQALARVDQASSRSLEALNVANDAMDVAQSHVNAPNNVNRSVRAPAGETLSELPAKELRAGKALSFDVNGDIVAVTPVEGSAESVLQSLRQTNGLSHIGLAHGTGGLNTAIKYLSFEMFGAVSGTTTDQTAKIQATVDAANILGLPIWSTGSYFMNGQVQLEQPIQITGSKFIGPASSTSQKFAVKADVTFDWCSFDRVYIHHTDGNLLVQNFNIENVRFTAAVFSEQVVSECTLELRYGTFRNCYFGYLRQGGAGAGLRANIMRGLQFFDMQGDCIEMNLCINDKYTLVEDIVIDTVDHLGTQPNWGIAMGFAGKGNYGITNDYTDYFKNLTLRNCRVYAARQCIHLEKSYNCLIENVELYPDNNRSTNANIEAAGLVLYGCSDITVDGLTGNPLTGQRMLWVTWGITANQYKSAGRNITLRNIDIAGSVEVHMATTDSFESFLDIDHLKADSLTIVGHASDYSVSNVRVKAADIEFHRVQNDGRDSVRRYSRCVANFSNVRANLIANTGVSLGRIAVDEMNVSNTNFPIRKTASSTTNRGTPITKVDGTYWLEANGFPWGYWFLPGDRIVNNQGTVYHILTEGCQFKSSGDTVVRAATAGATTLQGNTTENWTTVYWKTAGCKIVVPGGGAGGADLHTTIIRSAYIGGGIYTIGLADPLGTNIPAGTVIRPEAVCTYVTK